MIRIEDFLAEPLMPCLRLRVGPAEYDVVEIDIIALEARRDDVLEWMLTLPDVEGQNWRQLKTYTGGNGLMAKVLIALGHYLGAWQMFPLPETLPELWNREHPRVFQKTVKPVSRVPQPSRGDLEKDCVECRCCGRPAGPATSSIHDLVLCGEEPDLCLECWLEECDETCRVVSPEETPKAKAKRRETVVEDPKYQGPPGLQAYLKQFLE
jgi:hypothetical protein